METVNKIQKELFAELKPLEAEVQSICEKIAQIKTLGHSSLEEEQQLEKLIEQLSETRQRIEDLWQYAKKYGQA